MLSFTFTSSSLSITSKVFSFQVLAERHFFPDIPGSTMRLNKERGDGDD